MCVCVCVHACMHACMCVCIFCMYFVNVYMCIDHGGRASLMYAGRL